MPSHKSAALSVSQGKKGHTVRRRPANVVGVEGVSQVFRDGCFAMRTGVTNNPDTTGQHYLCTPCCPRLSPCGYIDLISTFRAGRYVSCCARRTLVLVQRSTQLNTGPKVM